MDDRQKWGDRWNPKDDWSKQGEVISGMRDGDFSALVALLRSGELLTRSLAEELSDMLEGSHPILNLKAKGRSGRKGWSEQLKIEDRRRRLGIYAEVRFRALGPGNFEAAIAETIERYPGHSRSYIAECRSAVLAILNRIDIEYREEAWQCWLEAWGPEQS